MSAASTDAQRMRRVRAHKKGDHSLCTPKTCAEVMQAGAEATTARASIVQGSAAHDTTRVERTPRTSGDGLGRVGGGQPEASGLAVDAVADRTPGGIETAVVAFVAALPYQSPDPRALLALVAVRLAQRVDETGALPAAVRELRTLLMQLVEVPNGPAGPVDEVRLRAAQRKLDNILATAA